MEYAKTHATSCALLSFFWTVFIYPSGAASIHPSPCGGDDNRGFIVKLLFVCCTPPSVTTARTSSAFACNVL
uniref:Putative secreted peptide n=1 Tax=Anopheles braziliensis TaxID=58242 RepID=A0A2M3ZWM2_9DIPT